MGLEKKFKIDWNDFQRDFRSNVRDPIADKLNVKMSSLPSDSDIKALIQRFLEALEEVLPRYLFGVITGQGDRNAAGADKYVAVLQQMTNWMTARGMKWAIPLVVPMIESAVRMVYRNTVESYFDRFGLEDPFEAWLGFTVDSGDPEPTPVMKSEFDLPESDEDE